MSERERAIAAADESRGALEPNTSGPAPLAAQPPSTADGARPGLAVDWKTAIKELAKALARSVASALVRGAFLVGTSFVLNLALAIAFFFLKGLAGGGHGSLLAFPIALAVFAPFVVLAFVLAHKNAVIRIVGAAVRSQAPLVARVGGHYLGGFLRERGADWTKSRAGAGMERAWNGYIGARRDAPWVVRFIVARVTGRIPLGEIVSELAAKGTPTDRLPEEVVGKGLERWAADRLEPSWGLVIALFAVNLAWFPIITWVIWK